MSDQHQFATRAIHAGQEPDPTTGAVMTPVYQVSTYAQPSPGMHQGYDYSRTDNPTRTAYQECLASLESGKHALVFSSGMAAVDAVLHTLKAGDHVICCDDVYGGSFRIMDKVYKQLGLEFSFVDLSDTKKLDEHKKSNTKLIWMETPTNPLLKILDIKAITSWAKQNGITTVVDNTFMSPYFQNPLSLGADIVAHSVTKYLGGHSDVVGGALITNDTEKYEFLKHIQNSVGAIPSPWDCFLVLRSLKTLHLRMERHQENAGMIAKFLEAHPQAERVIYPGLASHPQHEIAKKQMSGFGGMISFYIKGSLQNAKSFLESVQLFTLAESLGGVESLIEHPAIMTHASIPAETRESLGIHDTLIRLSVGVEDGNDLKQDLEQAFEKSK
jgi:cystathionine gamma-lyase